MAFVVLLFPFIAVSFFAFPTTDDYCHTLAVKELGYWGYQRITGKHGRAGISERSFPPRSHSRTILTRAISWRLLCSYSYMYTHL
jgi:hypothetical protein